MARPIRIEYPGAVYHVTSRGNELRKIFIDDTDRQQRYSNRPPLKELFERGKIKT